MIAVGPTNCAWQGFRGGSSDACRIRNEREAKATAPTLAWTPEAERSVEVGYLAEALSRISDAKVQAPEIGPQVGDRRAGTHRARGYLTVVASLCRLH